jgi:hypothetical protein
MHTVYFDLQINKIIIFSATRKTACRKIYNVKNY